MRALCCSAMALASLSDFSCSEAFCCARNVLVCSLCDLTLAELVEGPCSSCRPSGARLRGADEHLLELEVVLANLSCICSVAAFWMSLLSWMSSIRVLVWPMF